MEIKKLKSALRSPIASQSVDAVVFGVCALLFGLTQSWWWAAACIVWSTVLYARRVRHEAARPTFIFWVAVACTLWGLSLSASDAAAVAVALAGSVVIFALTGAYAFAFSNPKSALAVVYHSLVFAIAALAASYTPFDSLWLLLAAAFLGFYGITKNYCSIEEGGYDSRKKLYALIFALVATEVVFFGMLLPIGFINVGALALVLSVAGVDVVLAHWRGMLTKRIIIRSAAFAGGIALLVFAVNAL